MTETKKAWKLQECVAHSPGLVTCLSFGRKSGRIMATGGEDKKVNMWAVSKPSCIMSLGGNTSSVEAVEFSQEEDKVAVGTLSGSIRLWDLDEVKMVRALSGHKASVKCLDFHPYGEFVASGSVDSSVKLWDINRKGCIYTYKGHTGAVNVLRFSPDGKWVVSAGDDGIIKLWDLSAGKQLTEFTQHTGPVNCVTFHPSVLLLASASNDRTVKLFDLETFTMVSSTAEDSPAPVKRIAFHPEGVCIYAATADLLKIYSSEPGECMESIAVGWKYNGVADMAMDPRFNQLIGASISQSVVTTYVVDVKSCAPFVQPAVQLREARGGSSDRPYTQSGAAAVNSQRKSFIKANTKATPREQADTDSPETVGDPDEPEVLVIQDPIEYKRVFRPRKTLNRSPTQDGSDDEPFAPPSSVEAVPNRYTPAQQVEPTPRATRPVEPAPRTPKAVNEAPSKPRSPRAAAVVAPLPSTPANVTYDQPRHGVDVDDFLPKAEVPPRGDGPAANLTEGEVFRRLREPHESITLAMAARQKNLTTVRLMWSRDNIRTALESAVFMNDLAVLVDLLGVLVQKSSLWSLDIAAFLLPHLHKLIKSKYSSYVECACTSVKVVMKNFGTVIRQHLETGSPGIGVDLQREERQRKCRSCYDCLMAIRGLLETREVLEKAGPQARELQIMMQILNI